MADRRRPRLLLATSIEHSICFGCLHHAVEPYYDVVGTVTIGPTLPAEVSRLRPDAVVLATTMDHAIAMVGQLHQTVPDVKPILITEDGNWPGVVQAFRAGARGFLFKHSSLKELAAGLDEVLRGGIYVTPQLFAEFMHTVIQTERHLPDGAPHKTLTRRQREVVRLVASGHSNKEVAHHLGLTVKTVEYHKARILAHLELQTTADLIRYAVLNGLV